YAVEADELAAAAGRIDFPIRDRGRAARSGVRTSRARVGERRVPQLAPVCLLERPDAVLPAARARAEDLSAGDRRRAETEAEVLRGPQLWRAVLRPLLAKSGFLRNSVAI